MGGEERVRWVRRVAVVRAVLGIAVLAGSSGNKGLAGAAEAGRGPVPDARQQLNLARRGKKIFDATPKYASEYVGNELACGDCHAASGRADYAAPLIDVAGLFPMYSARAGHTITLEDRIEECFVRSEAGRPLPRESEEMLALVAYIRSLSKKGANGQPYARRGLAKLPELQGDPNRGRIVYHQCAICHGNDGAGMPPSIPSLWGKGSFNDGAGMNKPAKMAAYVYKNMPQGNPGALTVQDAYDVAAYICRQPRPKFNPAYANF